MKEKAISLKALCPFCGEGTLLAEVNRNASPFIKCSFCDDYEVEL